jgi:hypothetical protein
MIPKPFWQTKTLAKLTPEEWEALCDGCARCCVYKFEDEDSHEVLYTDVACRLLDLETGRCSDYPHRFQREPGCIALTPEKAAALTWLPESCAYRRLALGRPLPRWHPLRSGNTDSTLESLHSVCGRVVSGLDVPEDELEDHILPPE